MRTKADREVAPTDQEIENHAERVAYGMKQAQEPIPLYKAPDMQFGGCSSIGGEVWRKGKWVYPSVRR